ncbi:ABC-F family ATP-binding cassette domain-containing protein [Ornithinimicrobium avium]|uniref:ABC transporter ATP-binding protein n=1 Tax=Ornithinimicrobium avium TaxID=2283195 RepID=A0A345NPR5_9MICO|nr:ATP-binding cassette domain-containing protein [Ornithinimicrobium avium]AXH97023.1 ABC transporter ATP-binding protein [Ornithinimicrobium avium]
MGHVNLDQISFVLPDGRPLLDEVSFRVGEGAVVALVGPNGTGKTTLLRIVDGELDPHGGTVTRSGGLGVMRQFVGSVRDDSTVRDLLVSVAPERIAAAARALDTAELAIMEIDDEPAQMAYAQALADWGDVGGYEQETRWDEVTTAALGTPFQRVQWRRVATLSGGEQKRVVLEALLRGPDEVLLLDEPDNYLDVPGKRWLEEQLRASTKTVLLVSHDRELLGNAATRVVTLEPGAAGATAWTHPGSFATWHRAREERNARLEEMLRRWEDEHAKLRALVLMYKQKAAYNSDMAMRYQAAQTRLRRFEEAGPPEKVAREQNVTMRLTGGRTAKRAVVCERLELLAPGEAEGEPTVSPVAEGAPGDADSLMRPFDLEVWYGERVAVLGSNGSGKSHFLRLLAAGGSDPDVEHQPVGEAGPPAVRHTGTARLGSRVRPGWFAQTHDGHTFDGRTLLEILHRGDDHRRGRTRDEASRVLDRYELARQAEQTFDSLSGGQQARFQILMLELSGATLLLLDEPTDNLDLDSAEALEEGLGRFEGTVVAVTHDRWFARGFDRFLVFGADGEVYEADQPVWDERRVRRRR